ncbi:MAG: dimethyl sulfoxide reductase anchor subunit [Nitrospinae bacterium]|nr:dimethyl sulfoxide reductase anchor subunit [Nitrospinota bacterium]MBF0633655.1 dimethyl sulfoxide reductase anchor subunit [Nitrospinota bacterium]
MHPELSLVFLTVLAGVGQGLFIFLVAGDVKALLEPGGLPNNVIVAGSAVSVILTMMGMGASFFHLTHPERGWKAILKWKQSWLSREVLLLPAFLGLAFLYGLCGYMNLSFILRGIIGLAGVFTALALYVASGMVYAKIRYIREWNSLLTPVNFTFIGLSTGGLALVAVYQMVGAWPTASLFAMRLTFLTLALGFVFKAVSYLRDSRIYSPVTLKSALGVTHNDIRLMDWGSSYAHYNTKEYVYRKYADIRGTLKLLVLAAIFTLPFGLMILDYRQLLFGGHGSVAVPSAVIAILGAFVERWLFFAEGNHMQNLYYGAFTDKGVMNPLLTKAKAGTPTPRG